MVRRAEELAQRHGWFLARQFENPANPAWHRNTTAAEILGDFAGGAWITSSAAGAPAARSPASARC
jgi:cysteine synthase